MLEEVNKINEQLITIYNEMTSFQEQIASQNETIKELSSRCSANTNANTMLFSMIINANPGSKNIIIDMLTQSLNSLDNAGSKDMDKAFNSFLKSQIAEVLKFLQSPAANPHLRLVKSEPDDLE